MGNKNKKDTKVKNKTKKASENKSPKNKVELSSINKEAPELEDFQQNEALQELLDKDPNRLIGCGS